MLIYEMLLAILLGIVVATLIVRIRPRGPEKPGLAFAFFFLIAFPLIWAAGSWMVPIGLPFAGVSWLGFVIAGFFLLALILALSPPSRRSRKGEEIVPPDADQEALAGTAIFFGLFFWILLLTAAASLIARYLLI